MRSWHSRKGVVYVHYEDLRANTAEELQRVFVDLTGEHLESDRASAIAEEFSFARKAGRLPGEEDKGRWMRKGSVGDWRNRFSPKAREVFNRYAGDELILLGYESNKDWVSVPGRVER